MKSFEVYLPCWRLRCKVGEMILGELIFAIFEVKVIRKVKLKKILQILPTRLPYNMLDILSLAHFRTDASLSTGTAPIPENHLICLLHSL